MAASSRVGVVLLVLGVSCLVSSAQELPPEVDLCSVRPGHFPNGEHLGSAGLSTTVVVKTSSDQNSRIRCLMRFTSCNSCRLLLRPNNTFYFPTCRYHGYPDHDTGSCVPGCTYLHLYDPDYRNHTQKSYTMSSWASTEFYSESRTMYAIFCSNQSGVGSIDIQLRLSSEQKKITIRESYVPDFHSNYITSPMFPSPYAENDETYIYYFEASRQDKIVQLIFDDWQLSPYSEIWFAHSHSDGRVMANNSRPSALSQGSRLEVQFRTGPHRIPGPLSKFMGFKATYKFLSSSSEATVANTACGLHITDSKGGTIKFDQMKNPHDNYDCIWVIETSPGYNGTYVKIISYEGSSGTDVHNFVEIREGQTSLGAMKASLTPRTLDEADPNGYNSPGGFYIRLRGRYSDPNDFILAYSSYTFGETASGMFLCENMKNIPSKLRCDRYDHCGDGSDERKTLCDNGYDWQQHYSYTISTSVIIPMVISIFLMIVICLLIIFIRRCRQLAQQGHGSSSREPISSVSGETSRRHRRRNRGRPHSSTPSSGGSDVPPSYDEVIRTTPVGHLNMAFVWAPSDLAQPPSYEEATSPVGLGPPEGERLGVEGLNVSSSSSSSAQSRYPPRHLPSTGLAYSSSSLESSGPRYPPDTSSPSQSSLDSGQPHLQDPSRTRNTSSSNNSGGNSGGRQQLPRPSRPPGKVEDEFISPVSMSTLSNKGDKEGGPRQTASPPESGAPSPGASCTDVSGGVSSAAPPAPPAVAEASITLHPEQQQQQQRGPPECEAGRGTRQEGGRYSAAAPPGGQHHKRAASHGLETEELWENLLPPSPQTRSLGRSSDFPRHQPRAEDGAGRGDSRREDGDGAHTPLLPREPRAGGRGRGRPREAGPPRPRPPSRERPREGGEGPPRWRQPPPPYPGPRDPRPPRDGSQPRPQDREGRSRPPPRPQSEPRHNPRAPRRGEPHPRSPPRRDPRPPGPGPAHPQPRPRGRRGSDERGDREERDRQGRSRRDGRPGNRDDRAGNRDDRPGNRDDRPGNRDDRPANRDDRPGNRDDRPGNRDDRPGNRDDRPAASSRSAPSPATEGRSGDPGGSGEPEGSRGPRTSSPSRDLHFTLDQSQPAPGDGDSGPAVSTSGMTLSLCRGTGPEDEDIFV